MRRRSSQAVRLDRRDLQRIGLLSHRLAQQWWREVRFVGIIEDGIDDERRTGARGDSGLELRSDTPGSSMFKGFREFIAQGNVIDLAVAVVIGGAFTAIVNAVVSSIINPLVALFFEADAAGDFGPKLTNIYGNEVTFPLGDLISAIISFLAVALVVYFVFVAPMNKWKERQAAKNPAVEEPTLPTEQELLIEIRDLLRKNAG
jgi:large conductance mechanosensitive channel